MTRSGRRWERLRQWLQRPATPWVLGLLSALYVLPMADKFWSASDEGFILVNAQRVLAGQIPYRDFWTQYAPGQFYLLALLHKLFGASLLPGRLLTVGLHGVICGIGFAISRRLLGASAAAATWLLCTLSLIGRLGTIPWPTWTAIALGMAALACVVDGLVTPARRTQRFMAAGLLTGLCGLFRHDVGGYTWLAGIVTMATLAIIPAAAQRWRSAFRDAAAFSAAAAAPIALVGGLLWRAGALADAYEQLIRFPLEVYVAVRAIAWPAPELNPLMLFHQGMAFIVVNQFYLPLVIYGFVGIELIRRARAGAFGTRECGLVAVWLFGLAWLNYVRVRTDVMHLTPILPPAFMLAPLLAAWWRGSAPRGMAIPRKAAVVLVGLLIVPLSVKSADKYLKNTYKKPLRGQIRLVSFGEAGRAYVPAKESRAVGDVVAAIRSETTTQSHIYVGPSWHGNPQGAPLIFYFLAGRLPVSRYHEPHPGLTETASVQRTLADAVGAAADLVVLEETVQAGPETLLDETIRRHFRPLGRYGRYRLLKRS